MSAPHHGDALRAGETTLDLPPAGDAALRFIGRLRTPFRHRDMCPRQGREDGPECRVVLDAPFVPAMLGLESVERLELLYWMHEARRDLLTQNPKADGALRGTFSLRSPLRFNPIATSVVRVIRREEGVLVVRGLDCLDGTPLLDIKPERCGYAVVASPRSGASSGV